jgi:hypothetical protein
VYTQVTRLTRELAGTRPASPGHPYAKTREDPSMAFRFAGTRGHGSGSPASGLVTCPKLHAFSSVRSLPNLSLQGTRGEGI